MQWHPFTISSAPSEGKLRFDIKDMGVNTWTGDLFELASSCQHLEVLPQINYDGPYGLGLEYQKYEKIVIVVGGIGVTPGLSILKEAFEMKSSHNTQIQFIWTIRDTSLMDALDVTSMLEAYHDG